MSGIIKPPFGSPLYLDHSLAKGLVGCWLMNEGSGIYVNDSSGQNNKGTIIGMNDPPIVTSGWNAGPHGGALAFDGADNYIDCGNAESLDITGNWTIGAWYTKIADAGSYPDIIGKLETGKGYGLYVNATTGIGGIIGTVGGAGGFESTPTYTPADGQLHRYDVVYNGVAISLFVDGKLFGSTARVGATLSTTNNLRMGRRFADWATYGYINGRIHSASVYNLALSAEEIAYLYALSYCMFDETWHSPWTLSSLAYARYKILTDKNALVGTKVFYVADSSGGGVTRKLTFVDGILSLET